MDHSYADAEAETAFRQLFTSTYSPLQAYARRRTFDHAEADDVVSEVYATAWRRRQDLDPGKPALPWLYGIAANVLRNSRRAGGRRLQLVERLQAQPLPAVEEAFDGQSSSGSPQDEIRAGLARLSFDDQEVLRLVAWEGLSHAEAGEALGCSTNAVGVRIHRARQRLQTELDPDRPRDGSTRPDQEDNQHHTDQRRGGATS